MRRRAHEHHATEKPGDNLAFSGWHLRVVKTERDQREGHFALLQNSPQSAGKPEKLIGSRRKLFHV